MTQHSRNCSGTQAAWERAGAAAAQPSGEKLHSGRVAVQVDKFRQACAMQPAQVTGIIDIQKTCHFCAATSLSQPTDSGNAASLNNSPVLRKFSASSVPEAATRAAQTSRRRMRFTALAVLAATAHALTPSRKIKVARKNTLDSSVTFDEYQNIMV